MILPTDAATSRPTVSTSSIGPHRHAELQRDLVDHRARDAFVEGDDRFLHVGREDAVDQEAGRARDRHRQLVDRLAEGARPALHLRQHEIVLDDSTSGISATGLK
jgi:hypothetical protein